MRQKLARLSPRVLSAHPRPRRDAFANERYRLLALRSLDGQTRRAYAFVPSSDFLLHELDELNELGDRVQAKQRQEPFVDAPGLGPATGHSRLEDPNRLHGKSIDEPGN